MAPPAAGLPRSFKVVGIPVAGVLLTAFFIYLGFPYEQLGSFLAAELSRETQAEIAIESVRPGFHLAGLGLEATGIRANLASGERLRFDRAMVRPAWSFSWLAAHPAFYAELEGPIGTAEGVITLGGGGAWNGELIDVELSSVPLDTLWPGAHIEGRADASIDLRLGEAGPEGPIHFEAREGTISVATLPIALPYEHLAGELEFGGESLLNVKSLELEGPMLSAEVKGTIGHAPNPENAPLQLEVSLEAQPAIRSALANAGMRLGHDGTRKLRVSGTPANPNIR